MKILVFSDSHSEMHFMRDCIRKIRPDQIIHLGDYYEDGETIAEENPHLLVHQVPGNCDRYRCPLSAREIIMLIIGGVRIYVTHGHRHYVKMTDIRLLADAYEAQVHIVLYGHTHCADLRLKKGMWIMNPGTCGGRYGTCGLIEIENGEIKNCAILSQNDLEEYV